jgi:hypothetical protein
MKMIVALHAQFIRMRIWVKNETGYLKIDHDQMTPELIEATEMAYFSIPPAILEWKKGDFLVPQITSSENLDTTNDSRLRTLTEIQNRQEAGEEFFWFGNNKYRILEVNEINLKIYVEWDGYLPSWILVDPKNEYFLSEGRKKVKVANICIN